MLNPKRETNTKVQNPNFKNVLYFCYFVILVLFRISKFVLRIYLSKGQALSACQPTISVLFHPPPGVLFTFPSRYQFTIGRFWYLGLDRGRPGFPQSLNRAPWYLGTNYREYKFRIHVFHVLWSAIPNTSAIYIHIEYYLPCNTTINCGLACSAFARRY